MKKNQSLKYSNKVRISFNECLNLYNPINMQNIEILKQLKSIVEKG